MTILIMILSLLFFFLHKNLDYDFALMKIVLLPAEASLWVNNYSARKVIHNVALSLCGSAL